jgi:hypothetical protein
VEYELPLPLEAQARKVREMFVPEVVPADHRLDAPGN